MSYEYRVRWHDQGKAETKNYGQRGAARAFDLAAELPKIRGVTNVRLQRRWVTPWRDVADDAPGLEPVGDDQHEDDDRQHD